MRVRNHVLIVQRCIIPVSTVQEVLEESEILYLVILLYSLLIKGFLNDVLEILYFLVIT